MSYNFAGEPLVPAARLSHAELVEQFKALRDRVRVGAKLNSWQRAWLSGAMDANLLEGVPLDVALGLRPPRGSRRTPRNVARLRERDALLLRLATQAGGPARALRILRGEAAPAAALRPVLDALREYPVPRSPAAFTRARARLSRDRDDARDRTLRASRY